jgi:Flp pilus assembly protein TadD
MNFKAENKRIAELIKAGLEKLELGDAGAALLEFESALLFDDENFAANSLAAICLTRLDRSIEAEALALKAITLAPGLAFHT